MTKSAGLKLVVLGALCYGAHYRFAPDDGSVIELTAPVIEAVVRRQEEMVGRPLSGAEREAATESYIEEETLVREAFRRGLDRNDRRVRPMLLDHARRELLTGAGYVPSTPSPGELRAYFEERADDYRIPERVDLQQVLFPPGTEPSSLADVLAALRAGTDFTAMGAAGPGASVKDATRSDCAQAYGLDFATAVFAIEDDDWHGPLVSSAGTHFVRVPARSPSRRRSYGEVESYLEQDFLSDRERRVLDGELDRIRRRYRVEMEDVE
jgi:hypothetical protein